MKLTVTNNFNFATFYTLTSPLGIFVEICSLGASISKISLPDRNGISKNIVLTFADKKTYAQNSVYAGAVLAPNAGRIRNAILSIDKVEYPLTANDGLHNLHGGKNTASFLNWSLKKSSQSIQKVELVLETTLPDGQDGFPGNRHIEAIYSLTAEGIFAIQYTGTTDKTTYLNLSNHSYFNLSGDFTKDALSQKLQVNAERFIANDSAHLPKSIHSVVGTPFDFRHPISLEKQLLAFSNDKQLLAANGYNNGFFLSHRPNIPDAVLYDEISGRHLELYTNAPCFVLYSGGYLLNTPKIESGEGFAVAPLSSAAIALEAQDFPDAACNPLFPCHFITPSETAQRTITFRFSTI